MITILEGDVIDQLKILPDNSVHCCVTSPPYFGLRDYGIDGQIGLEKTPEEYTLKMVGVFQGVKRVLRDDGTLWLNLGDSYSGSNSTKDAAINPESLSYKSGQTKGGIQKAKGVIPGLKSKDLCGIPWRIAFALQADGWYLRSDIIWSKPNPMPESVTDRPTKAHEYLFLLSKNAKYYYDADAIREPHVTQEDRPDGIIRNRLFEYDSKENQLHPENLKRKCKDRIGFRGGDGSLYTNNNTFDNSFKMARNGSNIPGHSGNYNANGECLLNPAGRNRRTVWEIATQPTPEAHFATFPEALVEPCIKAGCPLDGTVLDPFGGSGTTGLVARNLKRNSILIEINPVYVKIMRKKLRLNEQLLGVD